MLRLRHKLLIHGLRIFDLASLAFGLIIAVAIKKEVTKIEHLPVLFKYAYTIPDTIGLFAMLAGWAFIYNRFINYDPNRFIGFRSEVYKLAKASAATAFSMLLLGAVFSFSTLSPTTIAIFWATSFVFGAIGRALLKASLTSMRKSGHNQRHLLIVGKNPSAIGLSRRIEKHPELGYKIVGFIDAGGAEPPPSGASINIIGDLGSLQSILESGTIDEIMVSLPFQRRFETIEKIVKLGQELGVVVRLIPDPDHARMLKRMHLESFEGDTVITLFREQLIMQLLAKRVMDLAISGMMIVLISPLLIGVALAVKLSSRGPVFFAQERVGMNKRRFKLLKFRSMVINAEEIKKQLTHLNEVDGPVFKIKNDPRVTKIGRIIRKTSIDELPQLFNVLKGEMSLVGPRPPLPSEVDQYEWLFRRRLSIKPGITCLWQVSGRNQLSFNEWMELDKEYIDNWSIWLDLKILFKTVPVVLTGHGAS